MRTTIRSSSVAVGLAALLATPAVASAQTFYGVAGGMDATYPGLGYFTVQGSIGRRISPRFEARVEAFVSHWDEVSFSTATCYPPGLCCRFCHNPRAWPDWRGMQSSTWPPLSMARGHT